MPGKYDHIENYEKEILELREKGLTQREIGNRLLSTRQEQNKPFILY